MDVIVDEHAFKHGLSEDDIRYAWDNYVRKQHRGSPNEGTAVAVGYDMRGRLIQIVAVDRPLGVLIYHAMTPPTRNVLFELGLLKGRGPWRTRKC